MLCLIVNYNWVHFLSKMFDVFTIEVSVFGEALPDGWAAVHQSLDGLCLVEVVIDFPFNCVLVQVGQHHETLLFLFVDLFQVEVQIDSNGLSPVRAVLDVLIGLLHLAVARVTRLTFGALFVWADHRQICHAASLSHF